MFLSTLIRISQGTDVTNVSVPVQNLPRCFNHVYDFSQRNCTIRVFSREQKSLNQLGWQNHRHFCPRQRTSNKDRQRLQIDRENKFPCTILATIWWKAKTKQRWEPNHRTSKLPTKLWSERITKIQVNGVIRRPVGLPRVAEFVDVILHQKRLNDNEKMQCLKINLTGQANVAISGLGFNSET